MTYLGWQAIADQGLDWTCTFHSLRSGWPGSQSSSCITSHVLMAVPSQIVPDMAGAQRQFSLGA